MDQSSKPDFLEDSVVIEQYKFVSRAEKSDKPFNLLKKTKEEVWDIVVFYLQHYFQGRYLSHEVVEVFEPIKILKRVETGTVSYILKIRIQPRF